MMTPLHIAVINFLICGCIFWSCICRLNSPQSKSVLTARARYSVLLTGSVVMGMQPVLFKTMPGIADTIFSGFVFLYLIVTWLKGKGSE